MGETIVAKPDGARAQSEPGDRPNTPDTAPAPSDSRWLVSAAIYVIAAMLALGALALLTLGPLHGAMPIRQPIPAPAMFALVLLLFVAAVWAPVELPYRGNSLTFALDSAPIILGLVFLRPSLLTLSAACAETIVYTLTRRSPLIKFVLNVSLIAFATALSALVYKRNPRRTWPAQRAGLGRGGPCVGCSGDRAQCRRADRLGDLWTDL